MTTTAVDDSKLRVISGLLAQAEGTQYPEEAEAFLVKAQELMARYSIDAAMLQSQAPGAAAKPVVERWFVPGPHANAKSVLLNSIAVNNSCRLVVSARLSTDPSQKGALRVTLFGFESDVAAVRAMFDSMLIVAQVGMLQAHKLNRNVHGKSFAHSFYQGFGWRLGQRLAEAKRTVTAEYGQSTALVLVSRIEAVDNLVSDTYGRLGKGSASRSSSTAGLTAGRAAADRANLSRGVGSGSRGALGR